MSFKSLSEQSTALKSAYSFGARTPEDDAWEGSPFDWLRKLPSATKGKIGRDFLVGLLEDSGFSPTRSAMKIEVNNKTIIVRTSLMWGGGDFKFEQFRDNAYDLAFCLGLYPDSAHAWLIPKSELIDNGVMQDRNGLTPQHGGQAGTEDFWLTVNMSDTPDWLSAFGGPINGIRNVFTRSL